MKTPMNCPFCGTSQEAGKMQFQTSVVPPAGGITIDSNDLTRGIHPENVEFAYECQNCEANGPLGATKVEALEMWDRRVPGSSHA